MQNNKNKDLQRLKLFYIATILLTAILILPAHILPQPLFMFARFPYYLEKMEPFLGISWPMSFEIYHYVLYTLSIIISLNVLGIIFYPRFKKIAIASSLIGSLLTLLMVLFFFFVFVSVNLATAITYGLYSLLLLIVNLLSFKALIKRRKDVTNAL